MNHLVIFDNEAVQALGDERHPKHKRVLAYVQVIATRRQRAMSIRALVPTSVRVEAGWDRTSAGWAFVNRLRVADVALDSAHANIAAAIRSSCDVSVADAHIGAAVETHRTDRISIVTSDPDDMRRVSAGAAFTIIAI